MSTNLYDKENKALADVDRKTSLAKGTTVPADATAGYMTGCIFQKTNGGETGTLYVNIGTNTSCQFVALSTGGGLVKTTTITNAQIKALRAAPLDLIAAPGAGKMIVVDSLTLQLNYAGTNVFTETTDNFVLEYSDGQDITGAIETTGFIDQSADTVAVYYPSNIAAMATATVGVNKSVRLFNTGDGEIAGNAGADNTMLATVMYRVVTII